MVLLDEKTGESTVVNPGVADRGFLPASTFKIANTLVALETGVVADEHFALPWDGKHRDIEEWNRDHDLTSAMRNADIGGGIDKFWLGGALRISAREQVDFLRRRHTGALPVTADHAALVRRILIGNRRRSDDALENRPHQRRQLAKMRLRVPRHELGRLHVLPPTLAASTRWN